MAKKKLNAKPAKQPPRAKGRPLKYSEELVDKICEKIACSNKGLHHILDKNKSFPSFSTFFKWLGTKEYGYLSDKYARAREIQAEFLADEIIDIADTCRQGTKVVTKPGGKETTTGDMVQRSNLMIEARKWKAEKLAPRKFGNKIDVTTQGEKINTTPAIITLSNGSQISID